MKKYFVGVASALVAIPALAGNMAACILDKAPSAKNDHTADMIIADCYKSNPGGFAVILKGSGRGLFSYKTAEECAMKKGQETSSTKAAQAIHAACNCLYGEPSSEKLTCT